MYERAYQIQNRLTTPHNAINVGALAFHVNHNEWDAALRVVQNELRVLRKHRQVFYEAQWRLKKCELLKLAGRDSTREIGRARKTANELKSRDYWFAKLEMLL